MMSNVTSRCLVPSPPSSGERARGGFKTRKVTRSVSEGVGMSSVESPSLTLRVSFETASNSFPPVEISPSGHDAINLHSWRKTSCQRCS